MLIYILACLGYDLFPTHESYFRTIQNFTTHCEDGGQPLLVHFLLQRDIHRGLTL